jgi:hypothetical protein
MIENLRLPLEQWRNAGKALISIGALRRRKPIFNYCPHKGIILTKMDSALFL